MTTPIHHSPDAIRDYIVASHYARYVPELKRREVWSESVARVRDMHLNRFADVSLSDAIADALNEGTIDVDTLCRLRLPKSLHGAIRRAFDLVDSKKVLPSMRSLQFGGEAIVQKNVRMFNCSAAVADRKDFFGEAFYNLLCGTGVGFSVQLHQVARLPALALAREGASPLSFQIPDTIEGWADSLKALVNARLEGLCVEFDYSLIRPAGSPIRTSGGRAPGPRPLARTIARIDGILAKAQGRKLRPIEVYDIVMHAASAVLSGGIRRSATICLFSPEDEEMLMAKTGDWFEKNPQRAASNNSAVLVRGQVDRALFDKLFKVQREMGEPGFFFTENRDYLCNPCVEIGMNSYLEVDEDAVVKLREYGYTGPLVLGQKLSGFSFCNLTTTNGALANTPEAFFEMCVYSALIGTLQAAYTDMAYLGPVTRVLNEREALIGVSICGILDAPSVLLSPEVLRTGAAIVKAVNAVISKAIGIRRAARTTCVKPEGTSSLVLGSSSGISPHHAQRYFRRVQANKMDPVYLHFREKNAHMTESSVYDANDRTDVITFCVEGPKGAIYREDITPIKHLEYIKLVQENWVLPGTAYETYSPGLAHNVSNTVNVPDNDGDWAAVADFIWANKKDFTGISLLRADGEKVYRQAPRQSVVTDEDVEKWNRLAYEHVDYTALVEEIDNTVLQTVAACAGGRCDLR